jgi:zinc protease
MKSLTEGLNRFETQAVTGAYMKKPGTGIAVVLGAIHAGPWHAPLAKEPVADVVSSLLDEGTKSHGRDEYRMLLEHDGSRVAFWADGRYLYFSVTASVESLERALALCFEALKEPALAGEEIRQVILREAADSVHKSEETRSEASRAFSRLIFAPESAGYEVSAKDERSHILALSDEDVRAFVRDTYRGRIVVSAFADMDESVFSSLLEKATGGWNVTPAASGRAPAYLAAPDTNRTLFVPIAGKESVDVFLGASLPMNPHDHQFPAFKVALDLLGGGFSDHLTQTIRDRDGLTYGTYARIRNVRDAEAMYWGAWAMFGNSLFEKGLSALKKEIGVFLDAGITAERLKEKVIEIEGRYAVRFSDMYSAANEVLTGLLAHGDPHAADNYLARIRELSPEEVEAAAKRHIRIDAIAAAGAIDEKGNLL